MLLATIRAAALLILATGSLTAWAAVPSPLPVGWILFDANRCALPASTCPQGSNFEIYAQDPAGNVYPITSNATYDSWWPKLSPDRTKVLFHRTDAGVKEIDGFNRTSLWVVDVATSSAPVKLIGSARGPAAPNAFGWSFLGHAEWSPAQNKITLLVVAPGATTTEIYVVPFTNSNNTVGTPYRVSFGSGNNPRPGLNLDPSFTLDGHVLFIGCNDDPQQLLCNPAGDSQELVVTTDSQVNAGELRLTTTTDGTLNYDPYYNTDGGQLGWLHENTCNNWDIRHAFGSGTSVSEVINDGAINSKPGWLNSNTLYFHRWPTIATTTWAVNATTGAGGLLEPNNNLNIACQSDGPTSTSTPSGGQVDPAGLPAGTVLFDSNRTPGVSTAASNWKIYTWTFAGAGTTAWPTGGGASASDGNDYYNARISPNRDRILFFRAPRGEKGNPYASALWVMNGDGSGATQLIAAGDVGNAFNWARFSGANWGPAGDRIVLSAATAAQASAGSNQIYQVLYSASTNTVSAATQLSYGSGTGDRPGANVQASYSPDGSRVAYTGCALNGSRSACLTTRSTNEIITTSAVSQTGESVITTTTNGTTYSDPSYSPNGVSIAAVHSVTCSSTQIVTMPPAGGSITTLLSNAVHFTPQWTFDGTSILFAALPNDLRSSIWRIDANVPDPSVPSNGTNLTAVTTATPCASEYPNAGR